MSDDSSRAAYDRDLARLPKALVDRFAPSLSRFLRIEAAAGAILLLSTTAALALSNSPWSAEFLGAWDVHVGFRVGPLDYGRSLKDWINDGLMTLFFFLVALELKRELVLGELSEPRVAALSVVAAIGGMVVPAALYLALQWGLPGQHGWGTVMATDTAFVVACLALLKDRIPKSLRVFMLSLAIVDDIGAILVVAIGYSHGLNWAMLGAGALCIAAVRAMAMAGFRALPLYFVAGGFAWVAIDACGIHATTTGVILGLMTPARRWVSDKRLYAILQRVVAHPTQDLRSGSTRDRKSLQIAEVAARETLAPVERLEMGLHPWVAFAVMPLFAFANAGLSLSWDDFAHPVTAAVFAGFAVGKPLGVFAFSWLAVRAGFAVRAPDLSWRQIAGGSILAGIGFTMALFIADLAFAAPLIGSAKLGIFLASAFSAVAGLVLLSRVPPQVPAPSSR
ncbi:Na+/H+ antiporter NhaA [Schlegelella sp. S2-27]|uniref:Na(+)/H(+) antiporter NhaA n=1 Tax=Caldimonas mangrovi TaxID=2944811 RepID=A0ABT0YHP7_9BURK|nr:Na+/H+ antiporter NhaA [Caldimonas mangrovi]MCM5678247.1 Na+/H+ antiporter NhaA [Caldimonas mangrovi]